MTEFFEKGVKESQIVPIYISKIRKQPTKLFFI